MKIHLIKFYIKKSLHILFTKGPLEFIRKFISFIRKIVQCLELLHSTPNVSNRISTVESFIDINLPNVSKIPSIRIETEVLRINIVTDTLDRNWIFGGVATSLILAILLSLKLKCPLRIITRDPNSNLKSLSTLTTLYNVKLPKDITIFNSSLNHNKKSSNQLPVSKKDIFISTSWWNSIVSEDLSIRKKYIYIIQEYEPIFYPNGDEQLLARSIFKSKKIIPVINTKILYKYFKKQNYLHIAKNALVFEPAFPSNLYKINKNTFKKKNKYKLFFYSRPRMPRNLFYTGLRVIDLAIKKGILDTKEWDIYFAGGDVPKLKFIDGYKPKILGKMDWEEYSNFTSSVDLALSFMYAPCPSYPPLDMVSSGSVVLTNNYDIKKNLDYSKNIIWSDPDVDSLLKKLQVAIKLSKNMKQRKINYKNNKISQSWYKSMHLVIDSLAKDINNNKL